MNDSTSILLATTVLALGGLGLYMFKTTHDKDNREDDEDDEDNEDNEDDEDDEDSLFGPGGIFNWGTTNGNKDEYDNKEEINEDIYKPRKKGAKTLKNRKSTGSSKRRY